MVIEEDDKEESPEEMSVQLSLTNGGENMEVDKVGSITKSNKRRAVSPLVLDDSNPSPKQPITLNNSVLIGLTEQKEESNSNSSPEPNSSQSNQNLLCTPNNFSLSNQPGSSSSSLTVKKSNLKKISKFDSLDNKSPLICSIIGIGIPILIPNIEDTPTRRRKKIRIVENFEALNQNNQIQLEEQPAILGIGNDLDVEDLDDGAKMFKTNYSNEEIFWISPSAKGLDYTAAIDPNFVKSKRIPLSKKLSVEIDYHFIDSETIMLIIDSKAELNKFGAWEFEQFAEKCKPFPDHCNIPNSYLKHCPFKYAGNAMKLANLDEAMDFDLTWPKNFFGQLGSSSNSNEPNTLVFYFGDIWVQSKGFREYILTKYQDYLGESEGKNGICKGFAFKASKISARSKDLDFSDKAGILFSTILPKDKESKLMDENLSPGLPVEFVDHFNVEKCDKEETETPTAVIEDFLLDINVSDEFIKEILDGTDGQGVHLLVADNPENFNMLETVREVRFQRKFYCQCIIALLAVRKGGAFLVKIFDSITPFTVSLIFLMHRCFKSISIHKPSSSSSSLSPERFLICKDKLVNDDTEEITQFLLQCHQMVTIPEEVRRVIRTKLRKRLSVDRMEVKELVPIQEMISHSEFFEFIRLTNLRITKSFTEEIKRNWIEPDLDNLKEDKSKSNKVKRLLKDFEPCLILHRVFDDPQKLLEFLCNRIVGDSADVWKCEEKSLNTFESLKDILQGNETNLFRIIPIQESSIVRGSGLFVGLGGDKIFLWERKNYWKQVCIKGLELPAGCVLFGDIVDQLEFSFTQEEDKLTRIRTVLCIIDVAFVCGRFVGDRNFDMRMKLCQSLACALKSKNVRAASFLEINNFPKLIQSISYKKINGMSSEILPLYFFPSHMDDKGLTKIRMVLGGILVWKIESNNSQGFLSALKERQFYKWKLKDKESTTTLLKDVCTIVKKTPCMCNCHK